MTFKLYEHVIVRSDLPAVGVLAGALGVVIELYADGSMDVEFAPDADQNLVIATVVPEQVMPVPASVRQAA
jgi:hypothetical protein